MALALQVSYWSNPALGGTSPMKFCLFVDSIMIGTCEKIATSDHVRIEGIDVNNFDDEVNIRMVVKKSPIEPLLISESYLLEKGHKIMAIKAIRARASCGLREAKDAADREEVKIMERQQHQHQYQY